MENKFKLGDLVKSNVGDLVIFEVTTIKKFGQVVNYSNEHIDGYFQEHDLEIVNRTEQDDNRLNAKG